MYRKLYFLAVSLLLVATPASALDWQLVDDGDPAPRGRYGMAYDTLRGKVILFGGDVGLVNTATDTWEYDGSKWEKKITSSQPTDISSSGAIQGMVYDTQRDRVVLLLRKYPNLETWEYDGANWMQITAQASPPSSSDINAIAYDPSRNKTVLYQSRPNSTWEYDGTDWNEVQTTNNPGDRSGYKMVFHSATNRVLLFGGWLFSGDFASDLWAYDGNDWTPVAVQNTPPPRGNFGLAYNSTDDKLILYGGYQSCDGSVCYLRDTWEFDGADWSEVTTSNAPSARHISEIIYDAQRNRAVLFGGLRYDNWGGGFPACETQIYFDDTWEFEGTNWVEIETTRSPPARMYPGLAYDSERNVVLLFGGKNVDMGCPLNDTWAYDGTWQEIQLNNPPPPIVDPRLAYDSNRKRVIMVAMGRYEPGGHCCESDFVGGTTTWEFDGIEWFMVNTPTPAPNLHGTSMTFDSVRNKVVAIISTYPGYNIEVWEYDGTDWTQVVTLDQPTPRRSFSIVFDAVRGKTVLFGGEDPSTYPYPLLHDTWEYDGNDWIEIVTQDSPEASTNTLMAFDSSREVIILYGGIVEPGIVSHDTWMYDGINWQKIQTSAFPSAYGGTQMVFDERTGKTVLFGGYDSTSVISGETWDFGEITQGGYQCGQCHSVGAPIKNCLASGCHDTYDNGNHHTTQSALDGMCAVCHNPALVANYDENNPSSSQGGDTTPTIQSCNNCHKGHENPVDGNGDPYPHPLYNTGILEHMDVQGHVAHCTHCHDPQLPYPIRQCETCHTVETLHNIAGHVEDGFWYDENGDWTEITATDRCIACHSNPPNPAPDTMLYVSQDVGTYDTTYSELDESDCRSCHGVSVAERHHALVPLVCECDLDPDTTVIHKGETLGFEASVTNNTDLTGWVAFATHLTLPGGSRYPASGWVNGPFSVHLDPYGSAAGPLSLFIPNYAPLGTYTYRGYVGFLGPPPRFFDTCQFQFQVIE